MRTLFYESISSNRGSDRGHDPDYQLADHGNRASRCRQRERGFDQLYDRGYRVGTRSCICADRCALVVPERETFERLILPRVTGVKFATRTDHSVRVVRAQENAK